MNDDCDPIRAESGQCESGNCRSSSLHRRIASAEAHQRSFDILIKRSNTHKTSDSGQAVTFVLTVSRVLTA